MFAKENCDVCVKAQRALATAGVEARVRYVDGPAATPDAIADFAWFDWTDKPPLVVVTDGDRLLKRWQGNEIADEKKPWLPQLRQWLAGVRHGAAEAGHA